MKNKSAIMETTQIAVKPVETKEKTKEKKNNKNLQVKRYEDGLWKVLHNKETDEITKLERISTPIEILALTRTEDNLDWGMLLQLTDKDNNLHTLVMKNSLLDRPGNEWLRQLKDDGGLWVKSDSSSFVKDFLSSADDYTAKRARLATKTGWSEDAKTFALPHSNIGENEDEMVVMQQSAGTAKMYKNNGTLEEWKNTVANKSKGNSRLTFMMCATLTGPVLYLVGAENGGFHIVGESSKGKSTALRLAASMWGDQHGHFKSWRTTDNAAESLAVFSNDSSLILDEVGEASSKALMEMAYMLANGSGKARAGRDGQARAVQTWRTTFLSSGEVTLNQKLSEGGFKARAGQEVRFVEISADAGAGMGVFEDCKGMQPSDFAVQIKEAASTYYGTAGPAFIEALIKTDGISKKIRTLSEDFANSICDKNADGQVLRVARRFGMCFAAGIIAVENGIFPHSKEDIEISVKKCFQSWLEMRGGQGASEDKVIINTIQQAIEIYGHSRFINLHPRTDSDGNEIEQTCLTRWGFRSGEEYYVLKSGWLEIFKGLDHKKAAKVLRNEGILECREPKRLDTNKRLPGMGVTRCYIIKVSEEKTEELKKELEAKQGLTNKVITQGQLIEGTPPEEFYGEILSAMATDEIYDKQ